MTRQRNLGLAAGAAVALAAAGAAFAAGKLHNGSPASTGGSAGSASLTDYSSSSAPRGLRFGGRHMGMAGGGHLAAAASYLGMTATELQTALQSGKTLAQVASSTSGKSVDGLVAALVADEQKEIAQLLKDGRITQAQADQMTANAKAHVTAMVNGTAGPGFGHGMGHGPGDDLQAAAAYLGIPVADLMTQLQAGKTLAQVADATSGKSASGLVDALVKAEQDELAQAVKDGRLTQAQADQLSADLKTRVTARVNGTGGPGMGFGHRDGDRGMMPAMHI